MVTTTITLHDADGNPVTIDASAVIDCREDSGDYVFEAADATGTVRDRFSFYGPYSAGYELAQQRGALYDAIAIHVEVN